MTRKATDRSSVKPAHAGIHCSPRDTGDPLRGLKQSNQHIDHVAAVG